MLKVSEAASLALHTASLLATNPDSLITTSEAAEALGVSENHLSKVLQRLTKAGLVRSIRGPKGGYRLARSADEVTLLDVYEAIEGPLPETTCLLAKPMCGGCCILGGLLGKVNELVREHFEGTKLSALSMTMGSRRTAGSAVEV